MLLIVDGATRCGVDEHLSLTNQDWCVENAPVRAAVFHTCSLPLSHLILSTAVMLENQMLLKLPSKRERVADEWNCVEVQNLVNLQYFDINIIFLKRCTNLREHGSF